MNVLISCLEVNDGFSFANCHQAAIIEPSAETNNITNKPSDTDISYRSSNDVLEGRLCGKDVELHGAVPMNNTRRLDRLCVSPGKAPVPETDPPQIALEIQKNSNARLLRPCSPRTLHARQAPACCHPFRQVQFSRESLCRVQSFACSATSRNTSAPVRSIAPSARVRST